MPSPTRCHCRSAVACDCRPLRCSKGLPRTCARAHTGLVSSRSGESDSRSRSRARRHLYDAMTIQARLQHITWGYRLARDLVANVEMNNRLDAARAGVQVRAADITESERITEVARRLVDLINVQQMLSAEVIGLADPHRAVILYLYVADLSEVALARHLGVPSPVIRQRATRALAELRRRLELRDATSQHSCLEALALFVQQRPARPSTP